ncbi:MAG TPA: hypothetical protein VFA94_07990 [Acidimicrobiales bacterium]|nr:hypothetical protein [Acidimicrobiales bacterium]
MDHETQYELDNLLHGFKQALHDVEHATDDRERAVAWRTVQTLAWRLHELLPAIADQAGR